METAFEKLAKGVNKAIEASTAALDVFSDIDFIQPALQDFVREVVPYLEEIKDSIDEVDEVAEEDELTWAEVWKLQEEVLSELLDEKDRADEIFSYLKNLPDAAADLLGDDVSDEVAGGFYRFIEVRLEPVKAACLEVYQAITGDL